MHLWCTRYSQIIPVEMPSLWVVGIEIVAVLKISVSILFGWTLIVGPRLNSGVAKVRLAVGETVYQWDMFLESCGKLFLHMECEHTLCEDVEAALKPHWNRILQKRASGRVIASRQIHSLGTVPVATAKAAARPELCFKREISADITMAAGRVIQDSKRTNYSPVEIFIKSNIF